MPRGRPKLPDEELKFKRKGTNKGIRAPYNFRPYEERGLIKAGTEPNVVKNFWKEYTMNQIETMTDEELIEEIDKYLEQFIYRQKKVNKAWDFPINPKMLAIDPNYKR